jgi:hypothetical protein
MAQVAQPADITAVQNLLKEVYVSDNIESQMFDDALLYSQIERTTDYHDSVGNLAVGFIRTGRNVGVSSRSLNGGTLGAAGHQQTKRWTLDYTASYLQLKILGTTIAKMATARQAAVREIDDEVSRGLVDLTKDIQRQLYSNGDALIIGCGTTTSSTTVVLEATQKAADVIDRGWLQVGEYIDIGTTANQVSVVQDAKITAVSSAGTSSTITIDSAVTTSATSFISRASNRSGTTAYESNGLGNLVKATGSFAGIAQSSESTWASTEIDAAAANLSRSQMQRAYRGSRQYGGKPDLIITSLNHQEDYYNLLQSQVRFAGDSNLASGTVDGPLFNNLPVVADPDCPTGVMYFLSKRNLFTVSAGDIAWQNQTTGGDVLAWVQNEDAFTARAAWYGNLGTDHRRAHSKVKSINVQ